MRVQFCAWEVVWEHLVNSSGWEDEQLVMLDSTSLERTIACSSSHPLRTPPLFLRFLTMAEGPVNWAELQGSMVTLIDFSENQLTGCLPANGSARACV